jgi:hypothetical protein
MHTLDLRVSTLLPLIFFLLLILWYDYVVNPVTIWAAQDEGGVVENEGIENDIGMISLLLNS